jgi:predicted nuclease with TOPRIM domain
MEETITKLDSQDLERLQNLNNEINTLALSLGQIELEKAMLETQKSNLLNTFSQLQKSQEELAEELSKKYGNGTINLNTGEITSLK